MKPRIEFRLTYSSLTCKMKSSNPKGTQMVKTTIILIFLFIGFCACSGSDSLTLEFRLAEEEPAPGLSEMAIAPSGKLFYLHDEVLLDRTDVDSAFVIRQSGRPAIELILTPMGARQFGELTENNVGKRCAMVLNGRLLSAPRIVAPIHVGRAIIAGDFTQKEARRIARGLSHP